MSYPAGVDLGTSSVKTMIMNEEGKAKAVSCEAYEISIPRIGCGEQDPEEWFRKFVVTLKRCMEESGIRGDESTALGFAGQMHGLVCVDRQGKCVCPAMIWPDQWTGGTISRMYEKLSRDFVSQQTRNTISTGFLIASLASNIGIAGRISTIASKPYYDKKLRTNTCDHVVEGTGIYDGFSQACGRLVTLD